MQEVEKNVEKNKVELKQELQADMANVETNMEQNAIELRAEMASLKAVIESRFEAEVGRLKAALVECFDEMKDVLVKFDPDGKREIIREGRSRTSGDRENILVAGGYGSKSAEMFDWRQQLWLPMQSLPENRHGATSFVYNNHVTIAGGKELRQDGLSWGGDQLDTMIGMNVGESPDFTTNWSEYPVKLPAKLAFHSSVVYNDQLIVSGGSSEMEALSDCIYEIQLSHPFTSKILSRMPEPRQEHGSAMFNDNLLIVGGPTIDSCKNSVILNSVLLYNAHKNEYKRLTPLPYEVSNFATVKYGDNIVVIGGHKKTSGYHTVSGTVVMYNVVTEQSHMLPPMKCKRSGSSSVVIGNNTIVLGGKPFADSVEIFSFDSNTWSDLPAMSEFRGSHTAVVV